MIKIIKLVSVLFIVIGLLVMMYPTVNNTVFKIEQTKAIEQYEKDIDKFKNTETDNNSDYAKLYKAVEKYNAEIYTNNQMHLCDKNYQELPAIDLSEYGLDIYGYIEIPSINVYMTIRLGADDENMSMGAVHLSGSSIPFGGKNVNSVIAGHCGYDGKEMFRYISNLNKNAKIKITTPFNMLTYKVIETKIINPDDTKSLLIQKGKDMVTLLTCHPYPTNKYRCVVYCERVNRTGG